MTSRGGMRRTVLLTRTVWEKPAISWSKAVLPLRIRRRELETKPSPDTQSPTARSEADKLEFTQLQQGELVFLKVCKLLMKTSFATFDKIPRTHASINTTRFYTTKIKGVTIRDEIALNTWLKWLSKGKKNIAHLKMPKAQAPILPSAQQSVITRWKRDRVVAIVLAESTRLILVVRNHPLPNVRNSTLLTDFQVILRGSTELRDTCMTDRIPLQEGEVIERISSDLTTANEAVKRILQMGREPTQIALPEIAVVNKVISDMRRATIDLKEHEIGISKTADERATMPGLLRRLRLSLPTSFARGEPAPHYTLY